MSENDTSVFSLKVNVNQELVIIDYFCQQEVKLVQLSANFEFETDDHEQNSCQLVVKSSRFFKKGANYLGIKVYKNQLDLFINQPNFLGEELEFETMDIGYDFYNYLSSNAKQTRFFVGRDLNGKYLTS